MSKDHEDRGGVLKTRAWNKDQFDRFMERVIHDEEFGEENVQMVDNEWAEFERNLR